MAGCRSSCPGQCTTTDYNGMTVSNLGEEKRYNPELQVRSQDEYVEMMNSLNHPGPRLLDMTVSANHACGKVQTS